MTQQYCDIENQCQHFCVYKQMVCPVYIRASHSNITDRDKFPSSGDLLLIAHDEWKRRQERKGFDDEIPWISGWISGYLTPKKFVDERLIKLRTPAPEQP